MNMLSTTALATTPQERREGAVLDVAEFIRREGLMLYDLFTVLGDAEGADAVADLLGLCSAPLPESSAVLVGLTEIRISLNALSFQEIDALAMSGRAPFDVYGAVRWTGARVADLHARLAAS